MTDTISLRDHTQPCEHPPDSHRHPMEAWPPKSGAYQANGGWYGCMECPGGKERTYRVIPWTGHTLLDLWKEVRVETVGTHPAFPGREVTFVESPDDKWLLVEVTE